MGYDGDRGDCPKRNKDFCSLTYQNSQSLPISQKCIFVLICTERRVGKRERKRFSVHGLRQQSAVIPCLRQCSKVCDDDDSVKFDDCATNFAVTSQESVKCIKLLTPHTHGNFTLDVKIF